MNVKEQIPAFLGACFFSVAPSVVSAVNENSLQPMAIYCVGIATTVSAESFDLNCKIQNLSVTMRSVNGPATDSSPQKPHNSLNSECNEPGDVIEQGFCLN